MRYPKPTSEMPADDEMQELLNDCVMEATDGCITEPDGECEHGHPSWLKHLGLI